MYQLRFSDDADRTLTELEEGGKATASKLKKVRKALAHLQHDPRYPGLHSHQYESFPGHSDVKVWDSYVENRTPGAWRIYWRYGPNEKNDLNEEIPVITVLVIGPHL
ncbi:hypothetical protein [Streptomyces megasporus]|uniref:hypothetical protein n=1 Tax=Streptomyces megasporus TaxID=44060 RepID=UPI0004E12634|nr:hypothetical protein [Streptomyces megasporus]